MQTSRGKIVAQALYASRLPRILAGQDYLTAILLRIYAARAEKCDQNHRTVRKIIVHNMIITWSALPNRVLFQFANGVEASVG